MNKLPHEIDNLSHEIYLPSDEMDKLSGKMGKFGFN